MLKEYTYKTYQKIVGTLLLGLLANEARADQLPAVKGAADWITKSMMAFAVTVLAMQIIYKLWQVNQGQKEPAEIVKPILITAAIVSVPVVVTALKSAGGF